MVSNKKRLYVALYPSGVQDNEERRYHWGFLIGPKQEARKVEGVRYHVKNNPLGGWVYEEVRVDDVRGTVRLLARILIGKVENEIRLIEIFRSIPVVHNDPNWRCRSWVAHALQTIALDGRAVGTSVLDWAHIESTARDYVREKTVSGRYGQNIDMQAPKPTWDMIEGREIVS